MSRLKEYRVQRTTQDVLDDIDGILADQLLRLARGSIVSDPRTVLHLDPARFLSDGDAVTHWRAGDDDNVCHDDDMGALMDAALGDYDADADLSASWEIAR